MKNDVDCQVFQDQLEALVGGTLPPEAMSQLLSHATACADCGMQLTVHRHLAEPSLQKLESAVPEEHLAAMWSGVQGRIAAQDRARVQGRITAQDRAGVQGGAMTLKGAGGRRLFPDRESAAFEGDAAAGKGTGARGRLSSRDGAGEGLSRRPWTASWLIPTLAAASLALVFLSGFLFAELQRAEATADALAERLEASPTPSFVSQAATGTGGIPSALQGRTLWLRALSDQEEIGIGVLKQMLKDLPGNPTLLDSGQLRELQRLQPALAPRFLRDALAELDTRGSLRARDLIRILDSSGLDQNLTVPTSRLIELLS